MTDEREPETLGPALTEDGTPAAWVRRAMARADACGIDARRVPVALGIPLSALDDASGGNATSGTRDVPIARRART